MSFSQRYQDRWERASAVRTLPRRRPQEGSAEGDLYPSLRQPLSFHPDVVALGPDAKTFTLVQSAYKYMSDVALTETEIVSPISTRIANGRAADDLPDDFREIALTVVVDESYHALVARNFISAVESSTGIACLKLPDHTELSQAIDEVHTSLDSALHDDFDVIAVCIAESTLTKEIVDLSCESELAESFMEALRDHLNDETMHATFFQRVLSRHWASLTAERQDVLAGVLPYFIHRYLNIDTQRSFDAAILSALQFAPTQVDSIVEDIHGGFDLAPSHPMLRNIVSMLDRVGVLSHRRLHDALSTSTLVI